MTIFVEHLGKTIELTSEEYERIMRSTCRSFYYKTSMGDIVRGSDIKVLSIQSKCTISKLPLVNINGSPFYTKDINWDCSGNILGGGGFVGKTLKQCADLCESKSQNTPSACKGFSFLKNSKQSDVNCILRTDCSCLQKGLTTWQYYSLDQSITIARPSTCKYRYRIENKCSNIDSDCSLYAEYDSFNRNIIYPCISSNNSPHCSASNNSCSPQLCKGTDCYRCATVNSDPLIAWPEGQCSPNLGDKKLCNINGIEQDPSGNSNPYNRVGNAGAWDAYDAGENMATDWGLQQYISCIPDAGYYCKPNRRTPCVRCDDEAYSKDKYSKCLQNNGWDRANDCDPSCAVGTLCCKDPDAKGSGSGACYETSNCSWL